MKNNYFFTVGAPITEERNFILFYKEHSLTKESLSTGVLITESGEKYPLFPLSELKRYLFDHKWTVLYSDSIKMENDDELTDFIRSEEIPVMETDEEFDRFLEEYYKVHPTEKTFVYYSQLFNDGGLIEVFYRKNNEEKYPTDHGINLFSDDDIELFLSKFRKTGFICSSMDNSLVCEVKRLAQKFGLQALTPDGNV